MKCAVVALRQNGEKRRFGAWRSTNYEEKLVYSEQSVTVYLLGADVQNACRRSEGRLRREVSRCIRRLAKCGVKSVYLTKEVRALVGNDVFEGDFKVVNGHRLFEALLCKGLRWCMERDGMKSDEVKIGIWQRCFDMRGYEILERICAEYNYVGIYTNDMEEARALADGLYERTGAAVSVYEGEGELYKCDAAILLDNTDAVILSERNIIIDLSGEYPYRCINSVEFETAFDFHKLMSYFEIADTCCGEFLLDACAKQLRDADSEEKAERYLKDIGCSFKKVLYTSNKKY